MSNLDDRRAFLRAAAAAGVAWAGADLLHVDEALGWAAQQVQSGGGELKTFTRPQADVVEAMTSRILPSVDGRPGAREAGVLYFVDRALSTFNAGQKTQYLDGIADLNRRAARKAKGAASFAALAPDHQDQILRAIEKSGFFQAVRFDTICGTFALPTWSGNRDHSGWRLIGLTHQLAFQPPFGYYDAATADGKRG
jgi:gluconate 2-dehydrogenase gamma chain